jgi:hypothetical protein
MLSIEKSWVLFGRFFPAKLKQHETKPAALLERRLVPLALPLKLQH